MLLASKVYPQSYPAEAVKVLNAMTFTTSGLKIMGSASLKSQKYAGDYDGYEIVEGLSIDGIVEKFKDIIKALLKMPNTFIGDIKAGLIEDWRVDIRTSPIKVESLFSSKIISSEEAELALGLLKKPKTKVNTLRAKDSLKFHIVRWTPEQILKGEQTLRDGRIYTLKEGIQSPTITKVDVISLVNKKYTDFSVIYEFHVDGRVINPDDIDPEKSLRDSITLYEADGNRYKILKRKFALAKLLNNEKDLLKYHKIINSELGKLYIIYSDVKTLSDLLEQHPGAATSSAVARELSGLTKRLRLYRLETHIKGHSALLTDLEKAAKTKDIKLLRHIEEALLKHLSRGTRLKGGFVYNHFPYLG